jgi:CubicO group peptidase (beta-lactamase class C family)
MLRNAVKQIYSLPLKSLDLKACGESVRLRARAARSAAYAPNIFFVASVTGPAQDTNPHIDAIFADLTKPGSPGCALGVYRDGEIIYAKGYGLANIEENVNV